MDDYLQVIFNDKGIGISFRDQKHIFQPFFRGKNAMAQQIEGNGLGLSIVSSILTGIGGDISVASIEDHGSTFTVNLPTS